MNILVVVESVDIGTKLIQECRVWASALPLRETCRWRSSDALRFWVRDSVIQCTTPRAIGDRLRGTVWDIAYVCAIRNAGTVVDQLAWLMTGNRSQAIVMRHFPEVKELCAGLAATEGLE